MTPSQFGGFVQTRLDEKETVTSPHKNASVTNHMTPPNTRRKEEKKAPTFKIKFQSPSPLPLDSRETHVKNTQAQQNIDYSTVIIITTVISTAIQLYRYTVIYSTYILRFSIVIRARGFRPSLFTKPLSVKHIHPPLCLPISVWGGGRGRIDPAAF